MVDATMRSDHLGTGGSIFLPPNYPVRLGVLASSPTALADCSREAKAATAPLPVPVATPAGCLVSDRARAVIPPAGAKETGRMPLVIARLTRFAVLLGLSLTVVAIGLGRMTPAREARELGGPPIAFISSYLMRTSISQLNLLDAEQGDLRALTLGHGDGLDCFSASPWTDAWGERHLAGRWSSTVGQAESTLFHGFGMARVAYPSGRVIDHVEAEVQPSSPPCWFPGTAARILFPAADGLLYSYSFEDDPGGSSPPDRNQPRPVRWDLPTPARRPPGIVQDIAWASPLGTSRLLVASILPSDRSADGSPQSRAELWWFRLSTDGSSVMAGGPLLIPDSEATPRWKSFRKPAVTTTAEGDRLLACLMEGDDSKLSLAVIPMPSDPATEGLRVEFTAIRVLADNCAPVAPAFSADGRWISFAQGGFSAGPLQISRARLLPHASWPSQGAAVASIGG